MLCGQSSLNNCSVVFPEPLSFPPNSLIGKYLGQNIRSPGKICKKRNVFSQAIIVFFFFLFVLLDQSESKEKNHHMAVALGASFSAVFLLIIVVGLLVWRRYRRNQQIFFDVNG